MYHGTNTLKMYKEFGSSTNNSRPTAFTSFDDTKCLVLICLFIFSPKCLSILQEEMENHALKYNTWRVVPQSSDNAGTDLYYPEFVNVLLFCWVSI